MMGECGNSGIARFKAAPKGHVTIFKEMQF